MARNFTLNFPSTALGPSFSTTGPTYVNHGTTPFGRIGIAFDDSADEAACTGMFLMPSEYTGSGTLKCDISYYTASATSGDLAMIVGVEAITDGDCQLKNEQKTELLVIRILASKCFTKLVFEFVFFIRLNLR